MGILIQGGRVVSPGVDGVCDVLVEGEQVSAIAKKIETADHQVIDASGKLVFPGGIDPHVHLDMPFMGTFSADDYTSGTRAALYGGTTSVIDFILQTQGKSLYDALREWQKKSEGKALGDYSYHMAITDFNSDAQKELPKLIHEEGICSFKTFMAYKGALMVDDRQLSAIMRSAREHGGMVTVHATNGDLIDGLIDKHRSEGKLSPWYHYASQPEVSESEASNRFCELSEYSDVQGYIVHMTCEGAVEAIRATASRGFRVLGETCIQYLLLDADLYHQDDGAKWVMSPPLRQKKDQEHLWAALRQGTIQVVATDHCPFTWEQKLMGKDDFSKIPNGHPAIEHRVELLYSEGVRKGKISMQKFVELISTNAAKIFGMFPKKGSIHPGADADIVIFDPEKEHVISSNSHHMATDYSSYEGWKVQGKVEKVLMRGTLAIDGQDCLIEPGYGQFLRREAVQYN
jgi:dihydropyrimidinase